MLCEALENLYRRGRIREVVHQQILAVRDDKRTQYLIVYVLEEDDHPKSIASVDLFEESRENHHPIMIVVEVVM